jgi:hypothetical protein
VLHQQRLADQPQDAAPVAEELSGRRQFPHKGLDGLEHMRHLALVMGKHNAFGEHVRHHQEPRHRHVTHMDRPARSASGTADSASFSKPDVLIRSPTLSACAVTRVSCGWLRNAEFVMSEKA